MMLELKEHVFARLNQIGFEEVQARFSRGEHLGEAQLVREWLNLPQSERSQTPAASVINPPKR